MFKIAICEDNKNFLFKLEPIIERKFFQYDIKHEVISFYSGEDLLQDILNLKKNYDIIFFDIELPGLNGIDTAKKIREFNSNTIFIFITHSNEKIYEALNLTIFHFIRKDHFDEEINIMFDLLMKKLEYLTEKYPFPIEGNNIYFKLHNILYLEVLDRELFIHTKENIYKTSLRSLKDIPFNLENKNFYEIYRGIVVNFNYVKDFIGNKIILTNGNNLFISRRKLKKFKEKFYKYISSKKEV
jgi:DNA-binding LytR/AlgR family response regulator